MTEQEQGLKKELSARQMAMVAVGGSIGTGLLLGSGAAVAVAGPAIIFSHLVGAGIAFIVTMALGGGSARHPEAGSFGGGGGACFPPWGGVGSPAPGWCVYIA